MIFFRVTQNINIKATDGTLVKYYKFRVQPELNNETVYITTYHDFNDLKEIFSSVDKNKYSTRLIKENKVRQLDGFPIELGISNAFEYLNHQDFLKEIKDYFVMNNDEVKSLFHDSKQVSIYEQLKNIKKEEISLVVIGGFGSSIGRMVASSTAIRILYEKLKEIYKKVNIDLYLDASNNTYYSRDKEIFNNQYFIRNIMPLSLTVKKFCEYDCFIDNSSVMKNLSYFDELNCTDAWLYKFGIDYKEIKDELKYNQLELRDYSPSDEIIDKIEEAKNKGKLLLYHPYSASYEKSIPQLKAIEFLKELIEKTEDYIIVSTLSIDSKFKDSRFLDLSKLSKSFNDFAYIISNMNSIITVNTSTYHISDAFMIPTVVLSTEKDIEKDIKYYNYVKTITVLDKSKNLSNFVFKNDELTLYKYSSWKEVSISEIIELSESF